MKSGRSKAIGIFTLVVGVSALTHAQNTAPPMLD